MKLPQPIKYTETEGGDWIEWGERALHRYYTPGTPPKSAVAHSIVFDNGCAFDMVSGWRDARKFKYDKKTGERI